jgi:hypothetical protein
MDRIWPFLATIMVAVPPEAPARLPAHLGHADLLRERIDGGTGE